MTMATTPNLRRTRHGMPANECCASPMAGCGREEGNVSRLRAVQAAAESRTRSEREERKSSESGQSVVEFALMLPLLCTLILLIVDFGKAMNYWIDLTHVSNQIARQAAVNSPVLTTLAAEC